MTRVLGVDYGTKRIGIAISDALAITARPLEVVARSDLHEALRRITDEYEIHTVVVGLPTGLSGNEGASANAARELGAEIEDNLEVVVEFVDERFTSRMAEAVLLESGMKRQSRKEATNKVAAAIILQTYLDALNRPGNPGHEPDVEPPAKP